jgi:1,4-dihydroxy-2-naphthoyl-CoA hydrolase
MAESPVWEPVVAFDRTFDARYGLDILAHDAEAGEVRARVAVRDELLTEHGLLHGGVLAGAAEAIASTGTALAVMERGEVAMGLSNDTTVLADVREGVVHALARAVHRGEREWVWTVDATDEQDRPVAHSRVTVAVRPLRRSA